MRTRAEKFCSGTNFLLCRFFLVINSRKKGREGTFGHVRYDMKRFAVLAVAVSALAISSQANAVHIRKQPAPSITTTATSTSANVGVPEGGRTLLLLAGALAAIFALRRKLAR